MQRRAVGFYWTLPVPWAGFMALPADVEEAAKASTTINYQCQLIRRYAKEHSLQLIHEQVFLEIEPDRGSEYVLPALAKVEQICRANDATLLVVDFSMVQAWRGHAPLSEWAHSRRIEVEQLWPEEITLDGQPFDPAEHFHTWRERQRDWTSNKPARADKARERAEALKGEGMSNTDVAATLNAEGVVSLTGKAWTADNVRKFLRTS